MNTLDEVIFGAPYTPTPWEADALHYLKDYKDDKDELDSTRLAYLDILTDYVALKNFWAEQQANPPLTWEELNCMGGKPVWVEILSKTLPLESSWGIATGGSYKTWQGVESWTLVRPGAVYSLPVAQYGKDWQAYRKERE